MIQRGVKDCVQGSERKGRIMKGRERERVSEKEKERNHDGEDSGARNFTRLRKRTRSLACASDSQINRELRYSQRVYLRSTISCAAIFRTGPRSSRYHPRRNVASHVYQVRPRRGVAI